MIIKGKYTEAVVFAAIIDAGAEEQIKLLCDQPFAEGSKIRIMPDVHAGMGCTIGTTMTIKDKIVPNLVGVDIGCGMETIKLKQKKLDLDALDKAIYKFIPSGRAVRQDKYVSFDRLDDLACIKHLSNIDRLERSIGTLGGGNHFIEVNVDEKGHLYLVIHSGSRNLGTQVAEYYQNLAYETLKGKDGYLKARDELIANSRAGGDTTNLEKALAELKRNYENATPEVPKSLAYLEGDNFNDYLRDMQICREFAELNRKTIAKVLCEQLHLDCSRAFTTVHNYIDVKKMILRKGAISAERGERVLIPLNMRDGSIIAVGKGNLDYNKSAPHGAGRLMSRIKARQSLTLADFKGLMEGIYTTSVNNDTLDECPLAYKPPDAIIPHLEPTVRIENLIKPIYNFKAGE